MMLRYFFHNSYSKLYIFLIATMILYTIYSFEEKTSNFYKKGSIISIIKQDYLYLINNSKCKIPESDPYNEDIVNFIKEEKYFKCSSKHLLTYISKKNDIVTLNVNQSLLGEYSIFNVNCCYSNITRINYEKSNDNQIKLSGCVYFENSVELKFPFVKVICSTLFYEVYANVHATTFPIKKKKRTHSDSKYSVLLLGIDSMSKANLKRTMPKTYEHVERTMVNLKGYNKIGDNTFPNLMAVLSGYSMDQLSKFCNKKIKQNNCKFIWDNFKFSGYTTAYAEDECSISTFNYDRLGFLQPPTDYYYHPYFIAAEKLPIIERGRMIYCAGPETSGERILNAARDFSITFNDTPSFGLFWSNSFSHDDVNMPGVMDDAFLNLLSNREFLISLKNTILIFFSDHGFRFGDIRYTHTGWLEERLPFMYIRVPDRFKSNFPEKFDSLLVNSGRLTTPWDIFNTLQDILKLQNDSYEVLISPGCRSCQSLFREVIESRSCADANIEQHWCTCNGHNYIDPNDRRVESISRFVVDEVNRLIDTFEDGALCMRYDLRNVRMSGVSEYYFNGKNESSRYFLVMVETNPPAMFEATVEEVVDGEDLRLLGEVSRIDRYEPVTRCIETNGSLKKYCYCDSWWARFKKTVW
ncbi:uncharacterized protein LOC130895563 [Diorhabda carinulata]|uniref:uncharacterized protein LOC130895563 n=1 Tax=Diorhabda carinulata TaxID=1163345 RepID=UPI0025A2BD1F|nr:uncharacterized protein LOC130895563 [Diorhabda carinulata]